MTNPYEPNSHPSGNPFERFAALGEVTDPLITAIQRDMPGAVVEISRAILREIPEYERGTDGIYAKVIVESTREIVETFAERLRDPSASNGALAETIRNLARYEVEEGRGLHGLEGAIRLAAWLGQNRLLTMLLETPQPAEVSPILSMAVGSFCAELEAQFRCEHEKAKLAGGSSVVESCALLVRELLRVDEHLSDRALASVAELSRWPLPQRITVIVLRWRARNEDGTVDDGPLAATAGGPRTLGGAKVLSGHAENTLHLLFPGIPSNEAEAELIEAFPGRRIVVGPDVRLREAADSLQSARRILELAESGIIPSGAGPVIRYTAHLSELWPLINGGAAADIVERLLGPFDELSGRELEWLLTTIAPWAVDGLTKSQVARNLNVDVHTVDYRFRHLPERIQRLIEDGEQRPLLVYVLHVLRMWKAAGLIGDGAVRWPRCEGNTHPDLLP